ncbi:MAG: hypothetical protein WCP98_07785, partial [Actinomycetes bacterium]
EQVVTAEWVRMKCLYGGCRARGMGASRVPERARVVRAQAARGTCSAVVASRLLHSGVMSPSRKQARFEASR